MFMANRFTSKIWVQLGIQLLAADGPDSLTVDNLCAKAKKTKGSFYFHFAAIEDLLIAVTEFWQLEYCQAIVSQVPPVSRRLDRLNWIAGRVDLDLESGIRKLAERNASVAGIVGEADRRRMKWLGDCYEASGKYDREKADALAAIEYAAFVGFRLIKPELAAKDARELYDAFLEFTGRA